MTQGASVYQNQGYASLFHWIFLVCRLPNTLSLCVRFTRVWVACRGMGAMGSLGSCIKITDLDTGLDTKVKINDLDTDDLDTGIATSKRLLRS